MPDEQVPEKKSSRWRLLKILAVLVLLLILGIGLFPKPVTTSKPVTFSRNEDGTYSSDGEERRSEIGFSVGQLDATTDFEEESRGWISEPAFFPSDSITIVNQSDKLFMQRAADRLIEVFKEKGDFKTIAYLPAGYWPKSGGRKSDLYVTIDLQSADESGILFQGLEAKIDVRFGHLMCAAGTHHFDRLDPPIYQFQTTIELNHQSSLYGIESSGSSATLQGNHIGEALATRLLAGLEGYREERAAMPELPKGLYPPYEPPPQLSSLAKFGAQRRMSSSGCSTKNETVWYVSSLPPANNFVKAVEQELSQLGWRKDYSDQHFLRMTSGKPKALEIYPDTTSDNSLWVLYRCRLGLEERSKVFESVLTAESPNAEFLLSLTKMADQNQEKRLLDLVWENPPSTVEAWVKVAKLHFGNGERDVGITAIQCANLIARIRHTSSDGVDELLTEQKIDRAILETSEAALQALGATNANETRSLDVPFTPGKLYVAFFLHADGTRDLFGVLFEKDGDSDSEFESMASHVHESGSGMSVSTLTAGKSWEHSFQIEKQSIVFAVSKDRKTLTYRR